MKMRTLALAAVLAVSALPSFADKSPMKPGKWEVTVTTEVAGVDVAIPPTTQTECITKDEAENPQPPKNDQGCELTSYKIDGNTITWSIKCSGGSADATGDGKMVFSGDSYTGTVHMTVGDQHLTQHLTGKYLGDCAR